MATDTWAYIKKIQTEVWLAKTPEERLRIFLRDNDAFFIFCQQCKKTSNSKSDTRNTGLTKDLTGF